MKPWTVLSSKEVMRDRFMGLRTDRCQRADGHIVEAYHVIELTDWVTVVPITETGNIVLVKEYRHAAGVMTIGLPGGVSDPGERDWAAVGARELREETGYTAREMHALGTCYPNPATQDNRLHYYLALGCRDGVGFIGFHRARRHLNARAGMLEQQHLHAARRHPGDWSASHGRPA